MKILIINYTNYYLETVYLNQGEQRRINEAIEEGHKHVIGGEDFAREFAAQEAGLILASKGYDITDASLSWMVADEVPVFGLGENIPYVTL